MMHRMHCIADPHRVQCISMRFLLFQLELDGHMPAQAHPWLRHYTCVHMYAMCTYVHMYVACVTAVDNVTHDLLVW